MFKQQNINLMKILRHPNFRGLRVSQDNVCNGQP